MLLLKKLYITVCSHIKSSLQGGAAKEWIGDEHGAQADEAVLSTEETVVEGPLPQRYSSWEVVEFEVAQGVGKVCA